MRLIVLILFIIAGFAAGAQTFMPAGVMDNTYRSPFGNIPQGDSISNRKWSFTKYSAFSSSFYFSKGGTATIFSAPIGLQANRRLNKNLYAFANVSFAPALINFNPSFETNSLKANQAGIGFNPTTLQGYSRAALGLQYINDEKTFSISGSIGVERSSYPYPRYYQQNNKTPTTVFPGNR